MISSYLRGEHVLGQVEGEGVGAPSRSLAREASVLQTGGSRDRGQEVAHAHSRKSSRGHGELAGVEQEGRARVQGVEELLTVQPRQSQAL